MTTALAIFKDQAQTLKKRDDHRCVREKGGVYAPLEFDILCQ
jgi:hypothetical protein